MKYGDTSAVYSVGGENFFKDNSACLFRLAMNSREILNINEPVLKLHTRAAVFIFKFSYDCMVIVVTLRYNARGFKYLSTVEFLIKLKALDASALRF